MRWLLACGRGRLFGKLRYGKTLPRLLEIDANKTVWKSAEIRIWSIGLSFKGDVSRSLVTYT